MDKGIRPAARNYFVAQNEMRRRGEAPYVGPKANTIFRKNVVFFLIEQFGVTVASACTHYNEAFKLVKDATPELVSGLGRAEDKKGGRKPKQAAAPAQPAATVIPTPASTLLQNFLSTIPAQPAPVVQTLISEGVREHTATHTVGVNAEEEGATPAADTEQTVFAVRKKSDDTVVAEGLSFEDAKALVEKAAAAKKAKLYWV